MLGATIIRTVEFCARHAALVALSAVLVGAAASVFAIKNFAITTDVTQLISAENSPVQANTRAFQATFPQRKIIVVIEAPTPETAQQAADRLTRALRSRSDVFASVTQLSGGDFFQRNALLFMPPEQVQAVTSKLIQAKPLLGKLASDASLQGVANSLALVTAGVEQGRLALDDLSMVLSHASDTLQAVLAGRPATFSWRALLEGRATRPDERRQFIGIDPILDYAKLEPGKAATDAIRQTATEQRIQSEYQASVKVTGEVPINDEQFSTVRDSAPIEIAVATIVVLVVLWLALRSPRLILPVAFALAIGFAVTAGLGLLAVGRLNLISIAFAVLFLGIGVDFGLQFTVRYRSERHEIDDLRMALNSAAEKSGVPLALAAAATAAAFFSFLPTDFRGLAELGLIAGCGMIIAFITTITVVPAALMLLKPPPERAPMGFQLLGPIDRFMMRRRIPIIVATVGAVALASPLLLRLEFDFNPLHLQNPQVEAVATYLELQGDPTLGANAINIVVPSLDQAASVADDLSRSPEVARTVTLHSFVPGEQDQKLAAIRKASNELEPVLNSTTGRSESNDDQTIQALRSAATRLSRMAGQEEGTGAVAARRLAMLLTELAAASPDVRAAADHAFADPLRFDLEQLRQMLKPEPITIKTLPATLARDWLAPNGHARVQVLPAGDTDEIATLRRFASAVSAKAPSAIGAPIALLQAADAVVNAFLEASGLALASIAVLLWLALRRFGDVLLTLVPLVLAAILTLELSVLIGLPLNFANIVALPLLLGVGVAFKIYYIMAWRAGKTGLLQSTLTRAVFFSAMTTGAAFGSLWLSNQPGLSSMGKLMCLALVCTLAAAVLFQPVLMGPPRRN
jgi:hypothetical protein